MEDIFQAWLFRLISAVMISAMRYTLLGEFEIATMAEGKRLGGREIDKIHAIFQFFCPELFKLWLE